ncbi:MAG: hypothetical protein IJX27_00825 [Clostridia bacterium]|nr:hypothetical protein [Clostridia bacterium]
MNIREYKRNLMVVKNIDSEIISEAFFILKSGAGEDDEAKISAEAERIIRECGECKKKRRTLSAAFIFVCACLGALALICLGAIIIAHFTA